MKNVKTRVVGLGIIGNYGVRWECVEHENWETDEIYYEMWIENGKLGRFDSIALALKDLAEEYLA